MNPRLRWCRALLFCLPCLLLPQAIAAAQQTPLSLAQADAYRAAITDLNRGALTRAITELEALARQSHRNFAVSESLGLALARQHRWNSALRWLDLAARLRPDLAVALNNLGITCLQAGRLPQALWAFQHAAAQHPDDFDSQDNYGQALAQAGHLRAAVAPLRRAWQLHRGDHVGYNLALALERTGQPARAAQILPRIPHGASIAAVQSLWGDVEEQLGHYQQAALHLQNAVSLAPTEANVFRLGMEFLRHWTLKAAITVLSQGHHDFPASLRISTALALAQYGQGDYQPALRLLGQLVEAAPANQPLLDFYGTACTTSAAGTPGCSALVAFARRHPANGRAAAWAGGLLLQQAQAVGYTPASLRAPRALLHRALALAPNLAETQFQAGLLDSIEHHWPAAVAHLERARSLRPNDEDIHFKLAEAYQHNGQKRQALAELHRHGEMIRSQQRGFDRRYRAIQKFLVTIGEPVSKRSGTGAARPRRTAPE